MRVETALRALIDAHYASIWRLLRRYGVTEDKTDDAAQEVFWIAARRLSDIKPGSESAFLYGIAIRVAARARREREPRRVESAALETFADDKPSAENLVDERRARELLDRVLDSMEEKLREVFVLFELEEIEIPMIAEILAIPVGTVGSRLRRAREEFSAIAKRVRAQLSFPGGRR
jgi:RNA polymerase sigma-70 factor (ECF subfamily)